MKLSVVIPVYKNKELFLTHLKHNYQYLKSYEMSVVDDASGAGIGEEINKIFPDIVVITHAVNQGFSQTINDGVAKSKGEFIFLLNSDVKLRDRSFEKAIGHLEKDRSLFAVSFAQIERDGRIVGKNSIYFAKGLLQHKKASDLSYGYNGWAEGGASIVRKKYFDALYGFDTLYSPFYWEDIDLSYRAYKRGWKVLFDPAILVEHHHESTIGKYFQKKAVAKIAFRNQFLFIWKNLTDKGLFLSHLIFLPYHLFFFIKSGRSEFMVGLFNAVAKLNLIIKRRSQEAKKDKLSDRAVLKIFNHE